MGAGKETSELNLLSLSLLLSVLAIRDDEKSAALEQRTHTFKRQPFRSKRIQKKKRYYGEPNDALLMGSLLWDK